MTNEPINQIEVLMEGVDENSVVSILNKWKEITEIRKQLDEFEVSLKDKIKNYLKERKWKDFYCADNKINVTLNVEKRESLDVKQLRIMLNPQQLSQVTRITTFERLIITTPEMRENMKKYLKKK